ncbi:tetratricopeptide repeat protein [Luteitalea sp.]|jgi:tetratricopeptide (TPR) repeat protein|uniref:tetratricopeptide repeat protein n=1 Tax=Luteitalea sp. TaxID=2004800 RepID=UPI0037CBAC1B
MSTRLTIVRLMAIAGLSLSLTACGKVTAQMSFKDGIGAYQQQNYRTAIEELEQAVQYDFEYRPYAYFYLANSHDNAFKFTRKGQPENDAHLPEAEKYYKLAYEQIDPASREGQGATFKKRSLEYLVGLYGPEKLNKPDQALEVGQQIVALDPKDVNNYFGLSKLYKDMGRMEEAEQMLMKAKEAAPNSVDVQLQLAGFYNSQGNFDKTMEAFQTRIQLEPNNPEAYHTVAGYFEEKVRKDYTLKPATKVDYIKRGLDASSKAIEIKGDYVEALVMKNLLLRQQALVEKSPARQQELLKEANALRDKAIETRNRLQGEAEAAEAAAKAKGEKKSE